LGEKMILSIVVITMNRAIQLKEAIDSCLACKLPKETELIVFDNGSTDNTGEVVESIKSEHPEITFVYVRADHNLGVGGGRANAYEISKGKYVYFLDDDAVISKECYDTFFEYSIDYLESHKNVASLSTKIIDDFWGTGRTDLKFKKAIDGNQICLSFFGGSHFLRKSCFCIPLYLDIKYASEEIVPSLIAFDKGFYNVLTNVISIDHHPQVNKWDKGSKEAEHVNINYCANTYASKRILYPVVFYPLLRIMLKLRMIRYFSLDREPREKIYNKIESLKHTQFRKISIITVCKLIYYFGLQAI
jgi:glycosyltransferase involved in cell wall biosynthesis